MVHSDAIVWRLALFMSGSDRAGIISVASAVVSGLYSTLNERSVSPERGSDDGDDAERDENLVERGRRRSGSARSRRNHLRREEPRTERDDQLKSEEETTLLRPNTSTR